MRKLLAALTAYLMLNIVLACVAGAVDFGDVPRDYWARDEIQYVTDRGLFLGRTVETFAPDSGMTRGQMAMVLYRLAGLSETDATMPYTDVPAGMYYYDAIRWAAKSGIFTEAKLTTNTLTPDETITRGEFAVMLRNYDIAQGGVELADERDNPFRDLDDTDEEVRNAILCWAYPLGVLRGTTPMTMNPNGRLTRAHVAAMLCRYDKKVNGASSLPFQVAPPHTAEELASGRLEPNDTYTLLVGEAYTDGNYAITSGNPEAVEIAYQNHAWQIRTKASGMAVLTITDKRTGEQQSLYVTVGKASAPTLPAESETNEHQDENRDEYRAERLEIIRLANEVRVRNDARECVVSEALMDAAQKFADTMPTGHNIPLEYQFRAEAGCTHGVGCNLYRSTNAGSVKYLPPVAVKLWEQSRGHYVTLVNKGSDSMGVGLHYDEETKTAYCVLFIGDCQAAGQLFGNAHR